MTDSMMPVEPTMHAHRRETDPPTVIADTGGFLGIPGTIGNFVKGGMAFMVCVLLYQGAQHMFGAEDRRWVMIGEVKDVLQGIKTGQDDLNRNLRDLIGDIVIRGKAADAAASKAEEAARKAEIAVKEAKATKEK